MPLWGRTGHRAEPGVGCIASSPLAQVMLTSKYLNGFPDDERAAKSGPFSPELITEQNLRHIRVLHDLASARGQTLAQMAIAWVMRDPRVTLALIGARTEDQLADSLGALGGRDFSREELETSNGDAAERGIDIWKISLSVTADQIA